MFDSTNRLPVLYDSDEDEEVLYLLGSDPDRNVHFEHKTTSAIGVVDSIHSEDSD